MSNTAVAIVVRRLFGETEATFTTEAFGLQEALNAAHTLAGMYEKPAATDAASSAPTAEAKPTTEKQTAKAGTKKPTAEAASSAPGATQATTAPAAAVQEKTSTDTAASSGDEEITYDGHVKPSILTIASKKGRETVTALLQRFGAGKGPDLKPDQYAEFHELAQKTLAGEYDPMAADEALA